MRTLRHRVMGSATCEQSAKGLTAKVCKNFRTATRRHFYCEQVKTSPIFDITFNRAVKIRLYFCIQKSFTGSKFRNMFQYDNDVVYLDDDNVHANFCYNIMVQIRIYGDNI